MSDSVTATVPGRNGGRLLPGGKPGNRGGPGRPPSAALEAARLMWEERLPLLGAIADGVVPVKLLARCEACGHEPGPPEEVTALPNTTDRLRAMDQLQRAGFGKEVRVEDVRARLRASLEIIQDEADPDTARRIADRMRGVWMR